MSSPPEFVKIRWRDRWVDIEYQRVEADRVSAPLIIFLHEGLGSLEMWRDFPQRLCEAVGCRGLVYSRPGYGRSTPRDADEVWGTDFLHRQAHEVLPLFLEALTIDPATDPPWLLGHSDGGSIALLYAARHPQCIRGLVVLAPHVMVEDISVSSIEQARVAYETTDLRDRLGRYHANPDSAFWGWNDVWLDPAFRSWSIKEEITGIRCPVLAVQGQEDPYGTMAQIREIARLVPKTLLLELENCAHSPHKDQPEKLVASVTDFIRQP
jgi:pimeloyl-ACP methyl ester carboxylesterase